ncbi:protein SODIUM POTASSIUM ROOT DEFECTIVE 2-like [Neltuma alba]|uniref:protein SODIUM POTASSIUM ROOT DEFECTIVE 2-like n=1 Tax=Neltuma alba TaxID=207710 RepID=UPI0010A56AD2|nr:protein SODIUM POTASSIUM ROOT DEFECTIVE 2-like [Prosopis alba]
MGKLGRILDTFCLSSSSSSSSCFCMNSMEAKDENEMKPLVATESSDGDQKLRLKDVVAGKQTLGFQLKPKIVMLKVSMHCDGCAKKVEKHVSKLEGVSSYKVDLENKMVVVVGDILPLEVLESVSRVKNAELLS